MKLYSFTDKELTILANRIKEVLLYRLENEKEIEGSKELSEEYAVIIHEKGFFGRIIDNLMKYQKDNLNITIVKVIIQEPDNDDDPELELLDGTNNK